MLLKRLERITHRLFLGSILLNIFISLMTLGQVIKMCWWHMIAKVLSTCPNINVLNAWDDAKRLKIRIGMKSNNTK